MFQESEDLLAAADESAPQQKGSDDEEEEELTPAEVVQRMKNAWLNEKFCPRLLPPATEVLDCLTEQLAQLENNLVQVSKTDFRVPLHKMEVARIRFLMTSYLRLRLSKIQSQVWTLGSWTLDTWAFDTDLLSREELTFAKSYRSNLETHFKTLALQHMPATQREIPGRPTREGKEAPPLPAPLPAGNSESAVFARAEQNVRGVLLEDAAMQDRDEEIEMEAGSQHILKYSAIEDLVREGAVRLI